MNLHMLRTLAGTSIALVDYTLDNRVLTPLLITQKPRYSVYFFQRITFINLSSIPLLQVFVELYLMILDGPYSHFSNN